MHDENRTYRDKPEAPQPLPLAVVDNHTHLDISRDGAPTPDVRRTIDEAVAVGVDRMVQVGCDLDGARFTERVIDEHPELLGAVALHPNEVPKLAEDGAPDVTVLHCFSGDVEMARECVERGYYVSVAGVVTFKNARDLRDALAQVPLENLLVETDAPYLTPSPHRGATNAPALVPLTVRALAEVKNVDVSTLCAALSENSERVYGPW